MRGVILQGAGEALNVPFNPVNVKSRAFHEMFHFMLKKYSTYFTVM